jgi:hypothetical protein
VMKVESFSSGAARGGLCGGINRGAQVARRTRQMSREMVLRNLGRASYMV